MDRTLSLQRRALLPALALLHLAALMALQRPMPRPAAERVQHEGELVFLLSAPPAPIHPRLAAHPPLPDQRTLLSPPTHAAVPIAPPPSSAHASEPPVRPMVPVEPPPSSARPPTPFAPPAAAADPSAALPSALSLSITLPADDPFANPHGGPDTLLAKSRRAVAAIDRDLRRERHLPAVTKEPELATKIAAAGVDRGFGMTERMLPNGDVITRVRTLFTSYCVLKSGPNPPPGRSPGQTLIVTCPK